MFPRNEKPERGYVRQNHPFGNRPLISQWPFLVLTKGWFPKGWFRRMFPRNENRNEGTFAKTTLLRNRPFSATAKRGFWKRGNCVKFGFLALTFLSSSYLWRLFGHLCSNVTPEMDPCWATEGPKTQPLSSLRGALRSAEICGKIFGKMRKLSEIVFLTSWTSNTVKQGVRKMSENVGNLAANFLRTPEVQSALQTPLCTALSSLQFCGLGFSCLVAHWHHNSQRFEPSISLPNSHGPFAHNQAMVK